MSVSICVLCLCVCVHVCMCVCVNMRVHQQFCNYFCSLVRSFCSILPLLVNPVLLICVSSVSRPCLNRVLCHSVLPVLVIRFLSSMSCLFGSTGPSHPVLLVRVSPMSHPCPTHLVLPVVVIWFFSSVSHPCLVCDLLIWFSRVSCSFCSTRPSHPVVHVPVSSLSRPCPLSSGSTRPSDLVLLIRVLLIRFYPSY